MKLNLNKVFSFLYEKRQGIMKPSLGRLMLAITFLLALYVWGVQEVDIPKTMDAFLMWMLIYVFGAKGADIVTKGVDKWKGGKEVTKK